MATAFRSQMKVNRASCLPQRNANCAARANGTTQAQTRRQGRCVENSWCDPPKDSARNKARHDPPRRPPLDQDAKHGPITQVGRRPTDEPLKLLRTPPAKTCPLQQPVFQKSTSPLVNRAVSQERHPMLTESGSPVPARRGPCVLWAQTRQKSQLQRTGCATQRTGPRLGKEQKQRMARIKSAPLNSASEEESTASLAATRLLPPSLGSYAWPEQFRSSAQFSMASGSAAIADHSRCSAFSLRHQRPCRPLVAIIVPWIDMFSTAGPV